MAFQYFESKRNKLVNKLERISAECEGPCCDCPKMGECETQIDMRCIQTEIEEMEFRMQECDEDEDEDDIDMEREYYSRPGADDEEYENDGWLD